jgi:hypothetical protein
LEERAIGTSRTPVVGWEWHAGGSGEATMTQVDPDDDSIWRITLRHYRYDPERRERRHVDLATFDNEAEFFAELGRRQRDLEQRRQQGTADPREHYTGLPKEPGYEVRRQKKRRALRVMRAQAARDARYAQRQRDNLEE